MNILSAVGIGLCGMAMHLLLEGIGRKDMAMLTSAACGAVILGGVMQPVVQAVQSVLKSAADFGAEDSVILLMLKVSGTALLTELAAQMCRDAGTNALAQKIELAGKGMILCAALPTLTEFTAAALRLLS